MNLIKPLILLLLNLEISLGAESIQISDPQTVGQLSDSRTLISKRSSAYKRLPGWRVYYGKRSTDTDLGGTQDLRSLGDAHDIDELLERSDDDLEGTSIESLDSSDISDSDNLSDTFYKDSLDDVQVEPNYKIDLPSDNLRDVLRELTDDFSNHRIESEISDYKNEQLADSLEHKRTGWNAIYGKRMPGWAPMYGKRGEDWSDVSQKRAPGWIATYGKRAPQWLATYGKRAPQWLATYGKRAPQWLATYGKRAPQWLATYGKRAPQWLATYGKRAPQWLATYGKRAPGWLPFYGKRSNSQYIHTPYSDSSSSDRHNSDTSGLVNAMPKRLPGWKVGYGKRGNRGWSALYG